jgi:GNAT superfamily N-acetyltransferase
MTIVVPRHRVVALTEDLARERLADLQTIEDEALSDAGLRYSEERWGPAQFMAPIPRKWDLSVCARVEEGAVVAFFVASALDPALCHHHRAAVRGDLRGRGVFREMANALMDRTAALGIRCVSAFASAGHEATEQLYRSLGFTPLRDEALRDFLRRTNRKLAVEGDVCIGENGHRKRLWFYAAARTGASMPSRDP